MPSRQRLASQQSPGTQRAPPTTHGDLSLEGAAQAGFPGWPRGLELPRPAAPHRGVPQRRAVQAVRLHRHKPELVLALDEGLGGGGPGIRFHGFKAGHGASCGLRPVQLSARRRSPPASTSKAWPVTSPPLPPRGRVPCPVRETQTPSAPGPGPGVASGPKTAPFLHPAPTFTLAGVASTSNSVTSTSCPGAWSGGGGGGRGPGGRAVGHWGQQMPAPLSAGWLEELAERLPVRLRGAEHGGPAGEASATCNHPSHLLRSAGAHGGQQ